NDSTLTLSKFDTTRSTRATRSSIVKSDALFGLTPIPTTTCSKSIRPRRMTSRWPSVSGSKVPVKTAIRDGSAVRGVMRVVASGLRVQVGAGPATWDVRSGESGSQAFEVVGVIVNVGADSELPAAGADDNALFAEPARGGGGIDPVTLQRDDSGE